MSASPPLLLHVFSSFEIGGAQIRFATLANHFGGAFRHAIIAMDGQTTCRERLSPGLLVEYPAVAIRKGDTLGNVRRFRAVLRALRPELLVTSGWGTIEWAMANLLPVARHLHMEDGFGVEERTRQVPRRALLRRLLLRRSTVMLPSRTLCQIAAESWKLPASCIRYVPNGVDLARFGRPPSAPRAGEPVIGTVAGLRPEKNVARLIRAFGLVRAEQPAKLVIVGEGGERARLEALADELGLSGDVDFVGRSDEPERFYPTFDVFALSSDTEQMPLSVLEAMASGLAIVATNVGDIGDMVAAGNKPFLTAPEDRALAAALLGVLRDPALRTELGAANRLKVERDFNQQVMFHAYEDLFGARLAAAPDRPSVAMVTPPGRSVAAEARR